jgi:tetratricopeptide (TPR) repeat protein
VPLLACCGIVGRSALAREWQERATAYFWEGDLSQAHERLEKAVRMAPGIPEVQADAGFFYLRVLELDDDETQPLGLSRSELLGRARAAFLRAINLLPVNSNAWSGLAEVYLQASVEQLRGGGLDLDVLLAQEGAGRLDRLYVAVVRKMMMLEPRNPYFHARLGDFLWDRGSRAAALSAYEDAFRLLPKIEEHPFLSRQGIPQEVLAAAVRGGEQFLQDRTGEFPAHVGHFNLSQLYVLLGDYPSAFRHLEAAVELLPEFSYYHYKLAALCFERGELERSRELAGRSIELGMRSEFPFILLARIARQRGETEEAIRFYRRALSSNPQNGRAALELAQEYERMRDFSRAEANYELAVELLPQDVHVLMQAVDYYTRRGSNVRAIPVLRKVVALRPHDEVYRQRLVQLSENEYMLR